MTRKPTLPGATAFFVSLLISGTCARPAVAQPQSDLAELQVRSVELSDIGPDSVVAAVRVSATARSSATLRGLAFDEVNINGVRVHVPPVAGPFRLRAGEAVADLPDLQIVLTFRELDSLDPLRRAVREGRARVQAQVRAEVELNLFQKLALLANRAWATLKVDQDVTVSVPGGPLGRVAALGALAAAEPVWIAGQSAQNWRRNRTALAESVRSSLPGPLVSLETRYDLKARDGEIAPMRVCRLGMLTADGQVIAPAEVLEPWSFDDALAEAFERGDVSVDESNFEILATPLSTARTYSLKRREVRIVRGLRGAESAISTSTKRRYHVRFRNSDTNAALLEIPALKHGGPGFQMALQAGDGEWRPAAVVRLVRPDSQAAPVLWLTEARLREGRYQIKDPVDTPAYGSPLWIEGGVAGLLQDESSAAEIRGVLKKLR
jgi:hypothetical protein